MALIAIKTNPTHRELRQFACLWIPLFCGALGLLRWKSSGDLGVPVAIWIAGAVVAIAGGLVPVAIKPLFVGLVYVLAPIGWVVSHVLLAVVYFGIITPIGLLLRLVGWDPMRRRFDRNAPTYWIAVPEERPIESYLRQF